LAEEEAGERLEIRAVRVVQAVAGTVTAEPPAAAQASVAHQGRGTTEAQALGGGGRLAAAVAAARVDREEQALLARTALRAQACQSA